MIVKAILREDFCIYALCTQYVTISNFMFIKTNRDKLIVYIKI